MDLSPSESFNLLYHSLANEEGSQDGRCAANLVDTILFHNGLPQKWLFTSEKTGIVMKKSGSSWNIDDIKRVFKQRFVKLRGKRFGEYRAKFATIWYVDAPQRIVSRVVDEDEFDHLLQNRFFSQYIAAVQLYFGGYPLKGSGWFEHRVWLDDTERELHQTFEFARPPEQPEHLDLNKFVENVNSVIQQGPQYFSSSIASRTPAEPQRLIITESQHQYLQHVSSHVLQYLCAYSRSKVVDVTFLFSFNSTWAPFVFGIRNVHLRDVPQSVHVMRVKLFSNLDSLFSRDVQVPIATQEQAVSVTSKPNKAQTPTKASHDHKQKKVAKVSRFDSMDVIPSFNFGTSAAEGLPSDDVADPTDPASIPRPDLSSKIQIHSSSNIDYTKREEVPVSVAGVKVSTLLPSAALNVAVAPIAPVAAASPAPPRPPASKNNNSDSRAIGGGALIPDFNQTGNTADSALQDYALAYGISFRSDRRPDLEAEREQRARTNYENRMKDFNKEKNKINLSDMAVTAKSQAKFGDIQKLSNRYSLNTDNWSRRVKAYPSQVRGSLDESWEEFQRSLRPLSAPPSRGQAMLARSLSGTIPTGCHGKLPNTRKSTGMERRTTMTRGANCHGDFCALAPQLVQATQERARRQELEEEERKRRSIADEESKRKAAEAPQKSRTGYVNFSMLAAVALKETEANSLIAEKSNSKADETAAVKILEPQRSYAAKSSQRFKTTATHDIPCKSVLMSRVEEKFTGFNYSDLVHQYTQMGFALEDILSECARMSLLSVADKCRAEAYRSACTMNNTPDFNSLNAMEAAHRKLVYTEALSKVHPSKFYQTVPVCETCFQLYSSMDAYRETIVFLRSDSKNNSTSEADKKIRAAGVTQQSVESGSIHKSVFSVNSIDDNNYYKNLQKTLSRYSRDSTDEVHAEEQHRNSERLAQPKYKSGKFERDQRVSVETRNLASSSSGTATCLPFQSRRPKTAERSRQKDQYIDGQISDRRTSKMPFQNPHRGNEAGFRNNNISSSRIEMSHSKQQRHFQKTIEDVPEYDTSLLRGSEMQNNSSYFVGEADDEPIDHDTELGIDQNRVSSYLLLANSVPRLHSQSGPTLGNFPISFSGGIPPRVVQDKGDPDPVIQLKNLSNIRHSEENNEKSSKVTLTDQHGVSRSYNNVHFVHSV